MFQSAAAGADGIESDTIADVDIESVLQSMHSRADLSWRVLGARAGTSHATLVAYAHGRVSPTADTVERVVHAAGFEVEPALVRRLADGATRGEELEHVLALAEQFPARHSPILLAPVFGR